jgi:uncharacterized protein (TIGR00266 family)
MSIIACQSCGKQYRVSQQLAGKRIRCKACGSVFAVPPMIIEADAVSEASVGAPPQIEVAAPAGRLKKTSDEIDYEIFGDDMQFCEITLDPGETVIAEAGAMMYMTNDVNMETVFGDPSKQGQGFWDKMVSAGKRAITGESIFMTTFSNVGSGREKVAFGAPYPGKILPLHLDELGGEVICQKDAFLCGAKGTQVSIAFQKKIGVGLFGGEGFIMQRLHGDGIVMVHAGGTMMHRDLQPGERLRLDTGCLMALTPDVKYDIEFIGGFKNTVFGGEGVFLATLTGPGQVWCQSLPFSRLAGRMLANAPQRGGSKGEGSLLGSLGDIVMGDNN